MNDILFGNNNKAVIKKLANRSFHSNKMRNVIVAIAIALTTFLFTAVLTIGMGASGTLEYSMAKLMGSSADALVQGLSEKQFQQLKENAMFEKVGCWIPVEIMTNTNRRVAEVDYADQNQLEIRMLTPRTGSAPQKANEVLVSANILKDLNIEEKIGAEIPVELKVRQSDQVYHFDMVVSGIYDTPNEKSESVIVSKAFLEENAEMMSDIAQGRVGCGIYTADVVMRDNYMVKDRISELVRNIGGNPDDASADNAVRVAPNPIVSNESGLMMWLVAGVFGVLFMFCGYLLIYNVFEIAVTNDIRQYGLLRTVGTTSRQIRRLVNRQALYLFLIGTPFGLLFGTLLGRSILPAALQIFAVDYSGGNIEVGTLPYDDALAVGDAEQLFIVAVNKANIPVGFFDVLVQPFLYIAEAVEVIVAPRWITAKHERIFLGICSEAELSGISTLHFAFLVLTPITHHLRTALKQSVLLGAQGINYIVQVPLELIAFPLRSGIKPSGIKLIAA